MSEYRRFVAYIYRYQEGKKEKNTGYVKVDARNGACRMQMRIQPADGKSQKLKVYGFVREGTWLLGILLGEAASKNGSCEWRMNTQTDHFGGSDYTLADICGMWIMGEQKEPYITVWDEEPVDVEKFTTELPQREVQPAEQEIKKRSTAEEPGEGRRKAELPGTEVRAEGTGQSFGGGLKERWNQFLYHYPGIQPFSDEEISRCVRLAPKDISFLGKREWSYGRNPFLQQAFMRYGHLLAGSHQNGQFILGVPGTYYDEQDRHLARMYGFPEFKKADGEEFGITLPEGEDRDRFGYWYHYIDETSA